jgi:hypothetical protein
MSEMTEDQAQDTQRLKRHLRAMSAVNRQLQAQLDGGTVRMVGAPGASAGDDLLASTGAGSTRRALTIRRAPAGSGWLDQLRLQGSAGAPFLVRAQNGHSYLIEGALRRRIKAGLLSAALRRVLGPARDVSDAELANYSEGPPVEVLEGGTGPAFVVVGGRRLPIRGLPLPYPVSTDEMLQFPTGEELNIATTSSSMSSPVARTRELLAREGFVRGGAVVLQKAAGRLRKSRPRA